MAPGLDPLDRPLSFYPNGDTEHCEAATTRLRLKAINNVLAVLRRLLSLAYERGIPLKVIQELMGHASMEMTMRYAHLSPEVKEAAVQVLDQPSPLPTQAAPETPEGHMEPDLKEKTPQPIEVAGSIQWRRRESNPGPKAFSSKSLRA